jgi:hypothetical protein
LSEQYSGGCLCGAVRYSVDGELREVLYCHCSQCRRQSGHYFAATNCRAADLKVEGGEHLTWFRASDTARRGFCRVCGSALFWHGDGDEMISVLAGSFDKPSSLKGGRHIFVADKGDYYTIDDGLPQHPQSG